MAGDEEFKPSLSEVRDVLTQYSGKPHIPNLVPVYAEISAEVLTPSSIYLKISNHSKSQFSFLFESASTETVGKYSFIGAGPRKVMKTGEGHGPEIDPLPVLEKELAENLVAVVPGLQLPPLTGGSIGYVGYDCVRYFEPKTKRPMKDVLKVPESLFMLYDTIVAFDRTCDIIKVITYIHVPNDLNDLKTAYEVATNTINEYIEVLRSDRTPLPHQPPIEPGQVSKSNIGEEGYKQHVKTLKEHIKKGDIIQAVPSQRFSYPTALHPFNVYLRLRKVNPSPYLFYINCKEFQIVGASPELLVKRENGRIITHPIAGTIKRNLTDPIEDERLANELTDSIKDRAEHVMLVDLARNDVNRVCDPTTVKVDRLMVVQKFSHVQHLVSQVSGVLRKGKTRFDAFRSIFPAGTVSGAPKVKAMELIAELEREKRGVYAGAVGYFGYSSVDKDGVETEGEMDTCIALRTMVVKDGILYSQAGGGIVHDSDEQEEYQETINKLKANTTTIEKAEAQYLKAQSKSEANGSAKPQS